MEINNNDVNNNNKLKVKRRNMKKGFKDPNKPKGTRSAYALFVQCTRQEMKRANVPPPFKDYMSNCASMWRSMDADAKKPYIEMGIADQKRRRMEMLKYKERIANAATPLELIEQMGARTEPKRALTSFFWFCHDKRASVRASFDEQKKAFNIRDYARVLGKMWKESPKEVRELYQNLAARDRERYNTELQSHLAKQTMLRHQYSERILACRLEESIKETVEGTVYEFKE